MRQPDYFREKTCYLCGSPNWLEEHHIFNGNFRKASERHNYKIILCHDCHTGSRDSVHNNAELRKRLKAEAQKHFEETHSREEFIQVFGRNYIMED